MLLSDLIRAESPHAVKHDMHIIEDARRKYWADDGWEQLQASCITETARKEIHRIEISKYRREEYASGML